MAIWEDNPYTSDAGAMAAGSGISDLTSVSSAWAEDDDPPESGADANDGAGAFDLFEWDEASMQWIQNDLMDHLRKESAWFAAAQGTLSPVDRDPYRRSLAQIDEAQRDQMIAERKQQEEAVQRQGFQLMWKILGPEVFNIASGAGVRTGVEDQLRMTQKAIQRAEELERERGRRRVDQVRENALTRAEIDVEEQEAEREAQIKQAEADAERWRDLMDTMEWVDEEFDEAREQQWERTQERTEAEHERAYDWAQHEEKRKRQLGQLIEDAGDDPQLWPFVRQRFPEEVISDDEIRRQMEASDLGADWRYLQDRFGMEVKPGDEAMIVRDEAGRSLVWHMRDGEPVADRPVKLGQEEAVWLKRTMDRARRFARVLDATLGSEK
jgi:hypothetical protein